MAVPSDLPDAQRPYLAARKLAFSVVLGQGAVSLAAALACWAIGGAHSALSAAFGGAIGTVASLGMALLAFSGRSTPSAARILGAFYAGEIVKVALAVVSFILVLKLTGASPVPMFAGYIATFIVYWIVLARMALPALSATRRANA